MVDIALAIVTAINAEWHEAQAVVKMPTMLDLIEDVVRCEGAIGVYWSVCVEGKWWGVRPNNAEQCEALDIAAEMSKGKVPYRFAEDGLVHLVRSYRSSEPNRMIHVRVCDHAKMPAVTPPAEVPTCLRCLMHPDL